MLLSREVPWSNLCLNYISGNRLKDEWVKVKILKKEKAVQRLLSWSKQEVSHKLVAEARMCIWECFLTRGNMKIMKKGGTKRLYLWIRMYESEFPILSNRRGSVAFEWIKKGKKGASLVAQWLGVHLPMRGTRFEPWSWKIPRATEQLGPCATTTEDALWSLWAMTSEACMRGAHAPQQERPPRWGARAPRRGVAPARCN